MSLSHSAFLDREKSKAAPTLTIPDGLFLVGLGGKIASGKDTIGNLLMKRLNAPYVSVSYGDALKNELQTLIDQIPSSTPHELSARHWIPIHHMQTIIHYLHEDNVNGILISSRVKTPGVRKALQFLGTDVRREQHYNYWVERALTTIQKELDAGNNVLVPDIRFFNELDALVQNDAFTLRLEITPETQLARLQERDQHAVIPNHLSETALDDHLDMFTAVLLNENASPKEISNKAHHILMQSW